MARGDGNGALGWKRGGDGGEGKPQIRKPVRKVASAKMFEGGAVQQPGPEFAARELDKIAPRHSRGDSGADDTASAGSGDDGGMNASFGENFEHSNVCQAANGPAAQSQSDAGGTKTVQTALQISVYSYQECRQTLADDMTDKIGRLAQLVRHTAKPSHPSAAAVGRTRFTRRVDATILWIRRKIPPLHWLGSRLFGVGFFIYAWLVAHTSRLVAVGTVKWPDVPSPCVLAIWHDGAPSLLAAIAKWKPKAPLVIMIATEPRGDSLEVLCRLLGVRVIRGDWEHRAWEAISRTAELVAAGTCAIITPDGGGPRRVTRPGALVLAAAAMAPLVAMGANCSPALSEPHKWDKPRNPVPFGKIAIALSEPWSHHDFEDPAAVEAERLHLERELLAASTAARQVLVDR